jgi:hypothetical protein
VRSDELAPLRLRTHVRMVAEFASDAKGRL